LYLRQCMPFGFSGNAPVTLSPPPRRIWIFRAVLIPRSRTGSCCTGRPMDPRLGSSDAIKCKMQEIIFVLLCQSSRLAHDRKFPGRSGIGFSVARQEQNRKLGSASRMARAKAKPSMALGIDYVADHDCGRPQAHPLGCPQPAPRSQAVAALRVSRPLRRDCHR
jgi:hypothetical protein